VRFRYLADPLFLASCAAYAAHRWLILPRWEIPVLKAWFGDFLLIPCLLPPVLWIQRLLGIRSGDEPPNLWEILVHAALWSALFEWVAPALGRGFRDWRDAIAYTVGGLMGWVVWNRKTALRWTASENARLSSTS
jgi:hypothetical protein